MEVLKHSLNQMLRLGSRNQDSRCHAKGKPIKLLLSGNVLHRFIPQTPANGVLVAALLLVGQRSVRVGEKLCAADAKRVQQQQLGIAASVAGKMLSTRQTRGSSGNGFS